MGIVRLHNVVSNEVPDRTAHGHDIEDVWGGGGGGGRGLFQPHVDWQFVATFENIIMYV